MRKRRNLILDKRIEIRPSSIDGYGVFAKDHIPSDTIIEEAYGLPFEDYDAPSNPLSQLVAKYAFRAIDLNWIALGMASIYNHSDEPNIVCLFDVDHGIFIFKTLRIIKKDEEIRYNYNKNTWDFEPKQET